MTPSREDFGRTKKKKTETFKTYATRWGTLTVQVTPKLTEKEILNLLRKPLQFEFYNQMLRSNFDLRRP